MTLPTEFPEPRARTTDRGTSHDAAAKVAKRAPHVRDAVLDTLRTYAGPGNPWTLVEAVQWYQRRAQNGRVPRATDSSIRTRVSELVRAGYVEDTKRKVTGDSNRPMTLWQLTDKGVGR